MIQLNLAITVTVFSDSSAVSQTPAKAAQSSSLGWCLTDWQQKNQCHLMGL